MAEEKRFENKVKKFLEDEGCWLLKTWGGGFQRSGIPDLLICCNGKFLGVELKAEKGKASALQMHEMEKITDARGIAMALSPSGFADFKELIRRIKNDQNFDSELYRIRCIEKKLLLQVRG